MMLQRPERTTVDGRRSRDQRSIRVASLSVISVLILTLVNGAAAAEREELRKQFEEEFAAQANNSDDPTIVELGQILRANVDCKSEWHCNAACRAQIPLASNESETYCKAPHARDTCFGIPITYRYVAHREMVPNEYEVLKRFPQCWSKLAPLICGVVFRPCSVFTLKARFEKPIRAELWQRYRGTMCTDVEEACKDVIAEGFYPTPWLTHCRRTVGNATWEKEKTDLNGYLAKYVPVDRLETLQNEWERATYFTNDTGCGTLYSESPARPPRSQCVFPLVHTDIAEDGVRPVMDKCYMPCRNPLISSLDRFDSFRASKAVVCVLLAVAFLAVFCLLSCYSSIFKSRAVFAVANAMLCMAIYLVIWASGSIEGLAYMSECRDTSAGVPIRKEPGREHWQMSWCMLISHLLHQFLLSCFAFVCLALYYAVAALPLPEVNEKENDGEEEPDWIARVRAARAKEEAKLAEDKRDTARARMASAVYIACFLLAIPGSVLKLYSTDGMSGVCTIGLQSIVVHAVMITIPTVVVCIWSLTASAIRAWMYYKMHQIIAARLIFKRSLNEISRLKAGNKMNVLGDNFGKHHRPQFAESVAGGAAAAAPAATAAAAAAGTGAAGAAPAAEPKQEEAKKKKRMDPFKMWKKSMGKSKEERKALSAIEEDSEEEIDELVGEKKERVVLSEEAKRAIAAGVHGEMRAAWRERQKEQGRGSVPVGYTLAAVLLLLAVAIFSLCVHSVMLAVEGEEERESVRGYVTCVISKSLLRRDHHWLADDAHAAEMWNNGTVENDPLRRRHKLASKITIHGCQYPSTGDRRIAGVLVVFILLPALPLLVYAFAVVAGVFGYAGMRQVLIPRPKQPKEAKEVKKKKKEKGSSYSGDVEMTNLTTTEMDVEAGGEINERESVISDGGAPVAGSRAPSVRSTSSGSLLRTASAAGQPAAAAAAAAAAEEIDDAQFSVTSETTSTTTTSAPVFARAGRFASSDLLPQPERPGRDRIAPSPPASVAVSERVRPSEKRVNPEDVKRTKDLLTSSSEDRARRRTPSYESRMEEEEGVVEEPCGSSSSEGLLRSSECNSRTALLQRERVQQRPAQQPQQPQQQQQPPVIRTDELLLQVDPEFLRQQQERERLERLQQQHAALQQGRMERLREEGRLQQSQPPPQQQQPEGLMERLQQEQEDDLQLLHEDLQHEQPFMVAELRPPLPGQVLQRQQQQQENLQQQQRLLQQLLQPHPQQLQQQQQQLQQQQQHQVLQEEESSSRPQWHDETFYRLQLYIDDLLWRGVAGPRPQPLSADQIIATLQSVRALIAVSLEGIGGEMEREEMEMIADLGVRMADDTIAFFDLTHSRHIDDLPLNMEAMAYAVIRLQAVAYTLIRGVASFPEMVHQYRTVSELLVQQSQLLQQEDALEVLRVQQPGVDSALAFLSDEEDWVYRRHLYTAGVEMGERQRFDMQMRIRDAQVFRFIVRAMELGPPRGEEEARRQRQAAADQMAAMQADGGAVYPPVRVIDLTRPPVGVANGAPSESSYTQTNSTVPSSALTAPGGRNRRPAAAAAAAPVVADPTHMPDFMRAVIAANGMQPVQQPQQQQPGYAGLSAHFPAPTSSHQQLLSDNDVMSSETSMDESMVSAYRRLGASNGGVSGGGSGRRLGGGGGETSSSQQRLIGGEEEEAMEQDDEEEEEEEECRQRVERMRIGGGGGGGRSGYWQAPQNGGVRLGTAAAAAGSRSIGGGNENARQPQQVNGAAPSVGRHTTAAAAAAGGPPAQYGHAARLLGEMERERQKRKWMEGGEGGGDSGIESNESLSRATTSQVSLGRSPLVRVPEQQQQQQIEEARRQVREEQGLPPEDDEPAPRRRRMELMNRYLNHSDPDLAIAEEEARLEREEEELKEKEAREEEALREGEREREERRRRREERQRERRRRREANNDSSLSTQSQSDDDEGLRREEGGRRERRGGGRRRERSASPSSASSKMSPEEQAELVRALRDALHARPTEGLSAEHRRLVEHLRVALTAQGGISREEILQYRIREINLRHQQAAQQANRHSPYSVSSVVVSRLSLAEIGVRVDTIRRMSEGNVLYPLEIYYQLHLADVLWPLSGRDVMLGDNVYTHDEINRVLGTDSPLVPEGADRDDFHQLMRKRAITAASLTGRAYGRQRHDQGAFNYTPPRLPDLDLYRIFGDPAVLHAALGGELQPLREAIERIPLTMPDLMRLDSRSQETLGSHLRHFRDFLDLQSERAGYPIRADTHVEDAIPAEPNGNARPPRRENEDENGDPEF